MEVPIKKLRVSFGCNNLLNATYFTRRAEGYPGPGIIPSDPRNYYLSLTIEI
jgi:Fe(3+) dicitrate transport protein